ncbi:hypothetical protein EK21DRAFT_106384 [Setomelanomma holmii]|uniref:Uncharacterized protein n=1 Tax=Setomelanomma holmii TaxID=210430 RepID=A0A9P4HJ88_9PLEO|nr:hypothetical protein EK21DRAFT_106384 [Setomelanomma holmii]
MLTLFFLTTLLTLSFAQVPSPGHGNPYISPTIILPSDPAPTWTPPPIPASEATPQDFRNPSFALGPLGPNASPAPPPPPDFRNPFLALGPLGPNATPAPAQPTFSPGDIALPNSTPGAITVCTSANFDTLSGGLCQDIKQTLGQCHNFGSVLRKKLTSIRPDQGQICYSYDEDEWFGGADWLVWPGSGNMRGRRFDKMAASWMCTGKS